MIANSEKTNRNNKQLGYINYHRTKSVGTQPIFSSKNITSLHLMIILQTFCRRYLGGQTPQGRGQDFATFAIT